MGPTPIGLLNPGLGSVPDLGVTKTVLSVRIWHPNTAVSPQSGVWNISIGQSAPWGPQTATTQRLQVPKNRCSSGADSRGHLSTNKPEPPIPPRDLMPASTERAGAAQRAPALPHPKNYRSDRSAPLVAITLWYQKKESFRYRPKSNMSNSSRFT